MNGFAALIPSTGASRTEVAAHIQPKLPPVTASPSKGVETLALVVEYASVDTRLTLAQVSRQLRYLVTQDEYWRPYLDEFGVDPNKHAKQEIFDTATALTVLDAGYSGSAYETLVRILRLLGRYYNSPHLIKRDFHNFVDQARVVALSQRLASLDSASPERQMEKLGKLHAEAASLKASALEIFKTKLQRNDVQDLAAYVELLGVFDDSEALLGVYLAETAPPAEKSLLELETSTVPATEQLRQRAVKIVDFLNEKAKEIDQIFGTRLPVYVPLLEKVLEKDVMNLVDKLSAEEKERNLEQYFIFVPEAYELLHKEIDRLQPCENAQGDVKSIAMRLLQNTMETDIEAFLDQQSDAFVQLANDKVSKWTEEITLQEHKYEQDALQNVPGSQEKSNFLRSFKKALMLGGDSAANPDASVAEFEAQAHIMDSKLKGIETLFSLELTLSIISVARSAIQRARAFARLPGNVGISARKRAEALFVGLVDIIGDKHIHRGFQSALDTLNEYDPKKFGRLVKTSEGKDGGEQGMTVEPLAIFAELVNIGDLIQQTIHVFFEQELAASKLVDRNDFVAPSVNAKRRFEQMLDKWVADGLSRGIDVLIEQIDFALMTVQLSSDYRPLPGSPPEVGATDAAKQVISLVKSHVYLLVGSTDKSLLEVFQQEVGLRLFHSLCKHIKRQTISQDGAIRLISDMNYYYDFIISLRQRQLYSYYEALKQISQLFLIDSADGRQLGVAISDMSRFSGVVTSDELIEFVRRREDWAVVKPKVEKVLYGFGECIVS